MKLFYSAKYVGARHACDTTRKASWIADSLIESPVAGIDLAEPAQSKNGLSPVYTFMTFMTARTQKLLGGILVISLFAGCATPTAYVSTITDPAYSITRQSKFSIFVDDRERLEDRRFAAFLAEQMRANQLDVVPIPESDYIVAFSTRERTSRIDSSFPITTPTTTYGNVGGKPFSGTTYSTTWVPYSKNYTVKAIWLDIYLTKDVREGKMRTVWEGYIGGGESEFREDPASFIRTLLTFLGRDHKAHTPLIRDER